MKERDMGKGLRECWQVRFEIRVWKATKMQCHLSRDCVETELRRPVEEKIWAEGPMRWDEWGCSWVWGTVEGCRCGWCRGSEREIGKNVGNEVRPSDLVIHDEKFRLHWKWGTTGEACVDRGSWMPLRVRQVSRRADGVFQERPMRLQEEEKEDRLGDTEHAGTTTCS